MDLRFLLLSLLPLDHHHEQTPSHQQSSPQIVQPSLGQVLRHPQGYQVLQRRKGRHAPRSRHLGQRRQRHFGTQGYAFSLTLSNVKRTLCFNIPPYVHGWFPGRNVIIEQPYGAPKITKGTYNILSPPFACTHRANGHLD